MVHSSFIYTLYLIASYFAGKRSERLLNDEPALLYKSSGRRLSKKEAEFLRPKIDDHKWYMSEKMGRDVGLKVAAIDYLENIYLPPPVPPAKLRSFQNAYLKFYEHLSIIA